MRSKLQNIIFPLICLTLLCLGLLLYWLLTPTVSITDIRDKYEVLYDIVYYIIVFSPVLLLFIPNKIETDKQTDFFFLVPLSAMIISTLLTVRVFLNVSNVCFAILIIYGIINRKLYRPKPYMWFFIAYFLCLSVSIFWSNDKEYGLSLIRRQLTWLTMPLAFCLFRLTMEQWNRVLFIFFRACMVFVVCSLLAWLYTAKQLDVPLETFFTTTKLHIKGTDCFEHIYLWTSYIHPSYNALGLIIGLIGGLYLLRQKVVGHAETILYMVCLLVLLLITQSRIGVLMYGTTVVMSIMYFIPKKKYQYLYMALLLLLGVSAAVCWFVIHTAFSLDPSRQHLFHTAIEQIRLHPILGVGLGELPQAIQNETLRNPHNQFLGDWLQSGLPALISLLAMLIYLLYNAIRSRNGLLLMLLIVMIFFMQIEMPFYLIKGIAYFTVFVCFFSARPTETTTVLSNLVSRQWCSPTASW